MLMRLIDADALKKKAHPGPGTYKAYTAEYAKWYVKVGEINDAPTIEAEPVRHGRWMWEGRFKACSLCGSYIDKDDTLGANHWKFCPYCGAKMDAKEAITNA